jgi:hypothetical protein
MIASCVYQASATATMRLSADGGSTWTLVEDNGPFDLNPTVGFVTYIGPVAGWDVSVDTGFGSPLVGSAITPHMDAGTSSTSSGPATLIVQLSDTNFIAFPNETFIVQSGGTAGGTALSTVYRDPGNLLFGTASSIITQGPNSGDYQNSNSVVVPGGSGLYSLTLETVIIHTSAAHSSVDSSLIALPPPPSCNCTLTFNTPASITNCAGDTIPDVTASQDCGNGSFNVPVTFAGAVTNGTCPKIITRTNTAMDSCGNLFTNVQTITLNCRGSICGHVFADCNGDGDLTTGDVGLSKVIVSLLLSNKVVVSLMSDANGGYCFTNLAGGCYVVAVTPPSGYSQTAASTSYHWKDSYGRICWGENDGYIHCLSGGTECWWDKSSTCHWKDSYGRDCWKDNWGGYHCQPCGYQSCNAQTNNNKISVCISNCASQGDVDFAYTGTKPSVSVCVSGPSYVKCGQTYTYTCTVTNTGNVCFTGGTVCHTIGTCNYWGGWNYGCQSFNVTCPPLSPGQHFTITQKCSFNSWNCGTVACQSTVNCNQHYGSTSGQSICYSQCSW